MAISECLPAGCNCVIFPLPYIYYGNMLLGGTVHVKTCAADVKFCLWVLGGFVSVESGPEGLTRATKAAQVSPLWLHTVLEAQGGTSNPPGF